jgi:hypothetical protein
MFFLTARLRRAANKNSRGQALVEFAIILPVLALLLVMAVDFGRVFFGWVGLTNAVRIAANEAARNPEAWEEGNAAEQMRYGEVVLADLQQLNCEQVDENGDGAIDQDDFAPSFTGYEIGDQVTVSISCDFDVLTPMAALVVGSPVDLSAESTFRVFGGLIQGVPVDPVVPTAACLAGEAEVPNLVGLSVAFARQSWTNAGFPITSFSPPPGADDADIVDTQTTSPTSSAGDCMPTSSTSVTVTHSPPPACGPGEFNVPHMIDQTVLNARSMWSSSGFAGLFDPATGYETEFVSAQVVSTGAVAPECAPATATVTVTHAPGTAPAPPTCTAPQLTGMLPAAAEAAYQLAGFTGAFTVQGNNNPTWKVKDQTLVGGQKYPCTASIEVSLKK